MNTMNIDSMVAMIPGSFPFPPNSATSANSDESANAFESVAASKSTDEKLRVDEHLPNENQVTISRSLLLKLRDAMIQANDLLATTTDLMTIPAKATPEFTFPAPEGNVNIGAKRVEQIFEDVVLVLQMLMTRAGPSEEESAEILEPNQRESDKELQQSVMVQVEDTTAINDTTCDLEIEEAIKEAMGGLNLELSKKDV